MSRLKRKNTPRKKYREATPTLKKVGIVSLLVACFILGSTLYWYRLDIAQFATRTYNQFIRMTLKAGMTIADVFITGHKNVSSEKVQACLYVPLHAPMLLFDMDKTYHCLRHLPWVHHVTLERHWPNTLYITLQEQKPFALWQHNKRIHMIDKNGVIIREKNLKNYLYLPSITGPHAPKHLPNLLKALEAFPDLRKRVVSASWVGNRRWNVHLDNKITLMLPESHMHEALKRFRKYEQTHQISQDAKTHIDLRIPKRIIIE